MKIIALGDSHFQEGLRFEECVRVHTWVADYITRERPDLVLHGGDVYDAASTPLERLAAAQFFQAVADVCNVLVVRGNHDRSRDLALLGELRAEHRIHVVEDARVVSLHLPGCEDLHIAACAWPSRASAVDEGAAREGLRSVLRGLGSELAGLSGHKVGLGHFMIDGALSGAGQPIIGGGLGVSLADLALMGADVVVASHIHRAQTFNVGGVEVHYAGSPFRTDHGEMEEKSLLSIRFEDGRAICERIPTPARPMLHLEGTFDGAALRVTISEEEARQWLSADIRLRYTVALEHRAAATAAAAATKARWLSEGAASVKVEAETVTTTRARSPEVAAARSLSAKVQALWVSKGDVPEPSRASRLLSRLAELEEAHHAQ